MRNDGKLIGKEGEKELGKLGIRYGRLIVLDTHRSCWVIVHICVNFLARNMVNNWNLGNGNGTTKMAMEFDPLENSKEPSRSRGEAKKGLQEFGERLLNLLKA